MPEVKRLSSVDLGRFRLPGDVQLSPDGRLAAYTVTTTHISTNDYESTIWAAAVRGDTEPVQLTRGGAATGRANDRAPRFSRDGKQLAFISNRAGAGGSAGAGPGAGPGAGAEVWLLDLDGGGEATQLTRLGGEVGALSWSPDGRWLAVAARPAKPAAPAPGAVDWERDGWQPGQNPDVAIIAKLQYKQNGRGLLDDRYQKVHLVEVTTGAAVQVTWGDYDDGAPVWSPDGHWIAFASSRRPDRELRPRTDLWAVDVRGALRGDRTPEGTPEAERPAAVQLTAGHPGSLGAVAFSPDGHWLLASGITTEMGGAENTHLWLIPFDFALRALPLAEGSDRPSLWLDILAGFDRSLGNSIGSDMRRDGGAADLVWSADGRWVLFTATDGGYCRLYRCRVPVGQPLDEYVPEIEELSAEEPPVAGSFAYVDKCPVTGGPLLAMIAGGPGMPGEIFVASMAAGAGKRRAGVPDEPLTPVGCPVAARDLPWQQVTKINAWLDDYELARPERVIFPGIEGGRLEGWLMKPLDFAAHRRHPVVLEIHGGPHVTYGLAFMHEFQLLCARGFGVFYTNPRGSKGYGYEFAARVVGDWAGIDFHDLMAAADMLGRVRWADPARMGVTGGSQGGYLTNFLIGHTRRFAAAVTQRSMSNLYSKYGVADNGWTHDKHGMGGADLWDSEELLMARSPIRYAPYVRTPTLVIHSDQDLRCPLEQGEQWYVALKRLGVTTEMVRFSGENHELSRAGKPRNRVERLERIVGWFDRFMGPGPGKGQG